MRIAGDCYDNALCESFFASLECELLDRTSFRTHAEAWLAIFDYIESFYNRQRRHSSVGYISPVVFENNAQETMRATRSLRNSGVESPSETTGARRTAAV